MKTVKKVQMWKTSDGLVFGDKEKALQHENRHYLQDWYESGNIIRAFEEDDFEVPWREIVVWLKINQKEVREILNTNFPEFSKKELQEPPF